jgi:peroxiredoxin Q/BCP
MMDEGSPVPRVSVMLADGTPLALADLAMPAVIYFYPKDDTSGCTREAQDFSTAGEGFAAAGGHVLGISKGGAASKAKFAAKHGLTVALADDESGAACDAFGVWGEKSMYGRTYMGIERATFLFDRKGRLARVWRKVRVPGHAEEVLATLRAL